MIDADFVKEIVGLAPVATFTETDTTGATAVYTSKPVHEVKAAPPAQAATVNVLTLDGLADLIAQKLDGLNPTDFLLHVKHHSLVQLLSKTTDKWGRRLVLAEAKPLNFDEFKFGEWVDQENFKINVAALFVDGGDKDHVLAIASTMTSDNSVTQADDGFSQNVTVKQGMRLPELVTVKPVVSLAPFRTFPECDQPFSPFVFRTKVVQGAISFKLILADGGKWKVAAIAEIARFLRVLNTGVEIVA